MVIMIAKTATMISSLGLMKGEGRGRRLKGASKLLSRQMLLERISFFGFSAR